MTREEFSDVTFNDLDPPGTRISRSLELSVVNSTEIALNRQTKRIFYESGDYRQDDSLCYNSARITPGMPGISPALVTLVPGTATAEAIPAGDTVYPTLQIVSDNYGKSY